MARLRWTLLALGAVVVALTFVATDDVTARFTAGMGIGLGAVVLGISEGIIRSTRNRPETILANLRAGIGGGDDK